MLPRRPGHLVDRPRAVGLRVAENNVVRLGDLLHLKARVAQLLRPLRIARDIALVHPCDEKRHRARDHEKRLHYREEADSVRPHRDYLGMPAERPHRVQRRQHERRGGKILEERREVRAEVLQYLQKRRLCLRHARERPEKLEKNVNGRESAQAVEERNEKFAEYVSCENSHIFKLYQKSDASVRRLTTSRAAGTEVSASGASCRGRRARSRQSRACASCSPGRSPCARRGAIRSQ